MSVYPALPEHRFDWHRDGSVAIDYDVTAATTTYLSAATMQALNSESPGSKISWGDDHVHHLIVYFAEPMTLHGGFFAWGRQNTTFAHLDGVEFSTDSTAPSNGTWTAWDAGDWNYPGGVQSVSEVAPWWRSEFSDLAAPIANVKAVRYRMANGTFNIAVQALHLYGEPAAGWGDRDKLRVWHPTLDQILGANDLDFGDPAVGTNELRSFRVKNAHTIDAHDLTVGLEIVTDAAPSLVTQFDLSLDGATFDTDVVVGDLAAGAISDLVYLRRHTSLDAMMDVRGLWVVATATW